jgi:hypothetical protein
MKQRWDGSIQSANTPTYDKTGISREDYGLYRCMIIDVLYVDDDRNISKNGRNPEVLYECVILGGAASGQTISFCRLASYLDGFNYSERTLKKTSKDISKIKLQDHDGDVVYVQFNQGHDAYPVIMGMARGINQKVGAKKADGPRFIESFNGVETNIDNKGNRTTTAKGGKTSNGFFTSGNSAIITETWDSVNEKLTRVYKSGLSVTEDGKNDKVEIKNSGGVTTTMDGKGNKISIKAGSTEIIIDGASGKISLKGDMVDLGASVSDFVTKFTELSSAFATHMHQYMPGPGPMAPTTPPMAPLLSSVGSQTVKVQS